MGKTPITLEPDPEEGSISSNKDDYKDLEGLAFENGADTQRGRQERRQYREGMRRGIGGARHWENR